jgi:16S rRNA (adenine1518-N6/adenine1519-N6)-dimethyltransferase
LHPPPDKRAHRPRKRFGQHFLHDPRVLERIVHAIHPRSTDLLVEIGPGEGALTRVLLKSVEKLRAIELDRDLAAALTAEFPEGLALHEGDALDFDFGKLPAGIRLVGNRPYNISPPLLFHLARFADRVRDMHFMLQREVVERMIAAPSTPEYGRLSVALQATFDIEKLFYVSKGAFRPPPKVESAVVRLVPRANPLYVSGDLLRKAFSARRKTLRNALAGMDLLGQGIDPGLRPENLSVEDYARLSTNSIL